MISEPEGKTMSCSAAYSLELTKRSNRNEKKKKKEAFSFEIAMTNGTTSYENR
jgi:hypothetical protein